MRKIYIFLFAMLTTSSLVNAQGIYQMWGMTQAGGADNNGVIFSTNASGDNFTNRFQFNNIQNSGAYPQETELTEYNGKFYGMTSQGGEENKGVIFEWNPITNDYTKKIDFIGSNGAFPHGSLTLLNGIFYGMTGTGGTNDKEIIFEWNPTTNTLTKKIDFIDANNGAYPLGNLTYNAGKFYGMTWQGGSFGSGVIFEWDPTTNDFNTKIHFNCTNGCSPYGNSLTFNSNNGKFYGMNSSGGNGYIGVIFEWDPSTNIYQKKIDLDSASGGVASGNLTMFNGKFYGMTRIGGANNKGVIFEWDPITNIYNKKVNFDNINGAEPTGSLNLNNGKFYGITHDGGVGGVVFEWNPSTNIFIVKKYLDDSSGVAPYGSLTLSGGKFYGMTSNSGANHKGTIFELDPSNNLFNKKIDFNGNTNSKKPRGVLLQSNNKFYGITSKAGINDGGVIFEWSRSYSGYNKKVDFLGYDGSYSTPTNDGLNPFTSLSFYNNRYYGMTMKGGDYFSGTIYRWNPDSNTVSKQIDFNGTNGRFPIGNLTFIGSKAYGMTSEGGYNGFGVIFEWDLSSNTLTKKFDFDTYNGSTPMGSLVLHNGKLYGMTKTYCSSNGGCIFEWDPNTNIFTKKMDFNDFIGSKPTGSLALFNGKFYGTTSYGSLSYRGTIFEWDPNTNIHTTKIRLEDSTGSVPLGSLTLSDGKFYGVTSQGGANDLGVLFEWDPTNNNYVVKKEFSGIDGANPSYGNDLVKYQVPVASGIVNSCTTFPSITINNTNNNIWVPIVDNLGDAVAEIKANGNNLGVVNTSMFINSGPVREDTAHKLYLDRNLTITPTVQPTTAVNIRLYLKGSEYEALRNATNSLGQPSGINSINDVGFFKNNEGCLPALQNTTSPVVVTAEAWNNDYVLTATINGFSSFYAANKASIVLSSSLLEFNARLINDDNDAQINWKTTNEINTNSFEIERSVDGRIFTKAGTVLASNTNGEHHYTFKDESISKLNTQKIYYRLKQKDNDGKFTYSQIVVLNVSKNKDFIVYPNPASETVTLTFSNSILLHTTASLIDMQGREVKKFIINNYKEKIDISNLPTGMYVIKLADGTVGKLFKN
jgi:uncharacterized repeat protein (TIGR03803 family)